ncbi:hypothetical protein [Mangrovicoccus ximenensis]|uniref:hypothetical protein n=1 Tax=Mangrovicoccus ximenensis TaxID=1911570 RepID=UPI0011AE67F6|nr:hypothetical protein [Mangrovicoccus ximenensis]
MTWTRACRFVAARIVSAALVLAVLLQSVPMAHAAPHGEAAPMAEMHAEMHHGGHAMHASGPDAAALPSKNLPGCAGTVCCAGCSFVLAPAEGPVSWIAFAYWVPEPVPHVPGPPGPAAAPLRNRRAGAGDAGEALAAMA